MLQRVIKRRTDGHTQREGANKVSEEANGELGVNETH
jgi:hypothetical protein